ncbi:MAG: nucleoside 2-deoxyribosyltransferase [Clostridiales bacterium]|nr:nucleoside 2-deoxyribosyltransferase [Clostridiales bacterium]
MSEKICFLICPIGDEKSEIRTHSDTVFNHILDPVMRQKGYTLIRADKIIQADTITDSIINYIENASLVIADITEANPNVYYELGYRTALKKPIIQIAEKGTELPFDISLKRTFFFDKKDLSSIENFKTLLLTLIDNIESNQQTTETLLPTVEQKNNPLGNQFIESIANKFFNKVFFDSEVQTEDALNNLVKMAELGKQFKQPDIN